MLIIIGTADYREKNIVSGTTPAVNNNPTTTNTILSARSRRMVPPIFPPLFFRFAFLWRIGGTCELNAVAIEISGRHYPKTIANERAPASRQKCRSCRDGLETRHRISLRPSIVR